MNEQSEPLNTDTQVIRRDTGVLPYQSITALIRDGEITAEQPIRSQQVQPASLDLRLGTTAYRMRASFLPGPNHTVHEQIEKFGLHDSLSRRFVV